MSDHEHVWEDEDEKRLREENTRLRELNKALEAEMTHAAKKMGELYAKYDATRAACEAARAGFTGMIKYCGARENGQRFFRACYPCHLPYGHDGDHIAEDGEWTPAMTKRSENGCSHETVVDSRCVFCCKWMGR